MRGCSPVTGACHRQVVKGSTLPAALEGELLALIQSTAPRAQPQTESPRAKRSPRARVPVPVPAAVKLLAAAAPVEEPREIAELQRQIQEAKNKNEHETLKMEMSGQE